MWQQVAADWLCALVGLNSLWLCRVCASRSQAVCGGWCCAGMPHHKACAHTHTHQSVFASGLRLPIVSAIRLLLDTCCPCAVLSAKKLLLTWMGITAQHGTARCCNE